MPSGPAAQVLQKSHPNAPAIASGSLAFLVAGERVYSTISLVMYPTLQLRGERAWGGTIIGFFSSIFAIFCARVHFLSCHHLPTPCPPPPPPHPPPHPPHPPLPLIRLPVLRVFPFISFDYLFFSPFTVLVPSQPTSRIIFPPLFRPWHSILPGINPGQHRPQSHGPLNPRHPNGNGLRRLPVASGSLSSDARHLQSQIKLL